MMNQWLCILSQSLLSPETGDGFRPWIAAVILIVSVIVLVVMIVLSKRGDSDSKEESYRESFQDEDDIE